jgi:hypothetical protein
MSPSLLVKICTAKDSIITRTMCYGKKNLSIKTDMVIIYQHILPKKISSLCYSNSEVILFQNMDEKSATASVPNVKRNI